MRSRLACAVALAATTAAGSSPTAAGAPSGGPWTAPASIFVSKPGTDLSLPAIATSAAGRALVIWRYELASGHAGQRAASWRGHGSLGRSHDLRTPIDTPLMYRDRAVALERPNGPARRVRVVLGSADGDFGSERTIYESPPDWVRAVSSPVANARGDIAVVHRILRRDRTSRIVLLERSARARFRRAQPIRDIPECRCYSESLAVAVALGARGEVVVGWEEAGSIFVRTRPAGGQLGPAVRVGRAVETRSLQVAVSPRGAVWVAWFDNPVDHGTGTGSMSIFLAVRAAGARRFGTTRRLDHVSHVWYGLGAGVNLALGRRGAGLLSWSMPDARSVSRVRLATADARGKNISVRALSASDQQATAGALLTSRQSGRALVVWSERYGVEQEHVRLLARLVSRAGTLGPVESVSTSEQAGDYAVAFDTAHRRALVVWVQHPPQPRSRTLLHAATRAL
ncbi:MAG TPA: hypothetical protein VF526_17200 [Solirubrobacteraceae bacterium]|jgi:hypothetical protein